VKNAKVNALKVYVGLTQLVSVNSRLAHRQKSPLIEVDLECAAYAQGNKYPTISFFTRDHNLLSYAVMTELAQNLLKFLDYFGFSRVYKLHKLG